MSTLFRRVEVAGQLTDVRVDGGLVREVSPGLRPGRGEEVVDGRGGALLPGLHDHHIHLLALAAARASLPLGPPEVTTADAFDAALRRAHANAPAGQWLRGVGYDEGSAGRLDARRLDALAAGRPVRVQHSSGAMWVVSTTALTALGLAGADLPGLERDASGAPTGRLFRLDGLIRERAPAAPPDLRAVGGELLRYGLTGVTDATPAEREADLAVLSDAVVRGDLPQRVVATGGPGLAPPALPGLALGPVKLVVADQAMPGLDEVVGWIRAARDQGRPVAVHCVTRAALALAVAAWDVAGPVPGDRVEHASVADPDLVARMAELGLTVVTQPSFVACRGDRYLADVDPEDVPHLYRCASLPAAGVPVGGSSDAPFGDVDPWRAIAAAMTRRTLRGRVLGPGERLTGRAALALYLGPWHAPGGPVRKVRPGADASLCLLAQPLADVLAAPSADQVAAVMRGSRLEVVHP